jgi:predicted site-specific integrase-resolvase
MSDIFRDRVLTFRQWCDLNGISKATGRRILARGELPVLQLSTRRIGIRESDNAAWQASRARREVRHARVSAARPHHS